MERILITTKALTTLPMLMLTLLCTTGCTGEEIPVNPAKPHSSIVFGDAVVTRGAFIKDRNFPEGSRLGVFAHHIHNNRVVNTSFINNLMITRRGSGYHYTPACFWPDSGELKFYAYHPYNAKAHLATADSLKVTAGATKLEFTCIVDTLSSNQFDLMFAATRTLSKTDVSFRFSHALSALDFEVKKDSLYRSKDVKLYAITLKNVKRHGHLTITADTVWTITSGGTTTGNINVALANSPVPIALNYRKVTGDNSPILLPQDTDGMTVSLDVRIDGVPKKYDIALKGVGRWNMNDWITYKLIISDQLAHSSQP
jgi:hypothetical protein